MSGDDRSKKDGERTNKDNQRMRGAHLEPPKEDLVRDEEEREREGLKPKR